MTDKTLPSHATLAPAQAAQQATFTPWLRALWQRIAQGTAKPSQTGSATAVALQVHERIELQLVRRSWLVVQQGSCTITLPMQWQAEHLVQTQFVLHEGDAWQVPETGHYLLSHSPATRGAARGMATATSRVLVSKNR